MVTNDNDRPHVWRGHIRHTRFVDAEGVEYEVEEVAAECRAIRRPRKPGEPQTYDHSYEVLAPDDMGAKRGYRITRVVTPVAREVTPIAGLDPDKWENDDPDTICGVGDVIIVEEFAPHYDRISATPTYDAVQLALGEARSTIFAELMAMAPRDRWEAFSMDNRLIEDAVHIMREAEQMLGGMMADQSWNK
jgi:hypothetical protein